GEDPQGIPNNLLPYVSKVAGGKLEKLHVFGDDYATHDGTGVRDYIHVVDLAEAHLKALSYAEGRTGIDYFNVGTGTGYSVLDIVKAYERVSGKQVPYVIEERRPGDIDECYADPRKAYELLGWSARYNLEDMCRDLDHWQTMNPNGYEE
ncbi:MAG: GDP-mannose 4,6-dehydratase, partial [Clostridia bacterium]|nr:GDP-mannose 4,6-dehydratase [Clostridia bacterium]